MSIEKRFRYLSVCYPWRKNKILLEVWTRDGNRGILKVPPIHIEMKSKGETVRRKQYAISLKGRPELQPIIEKLPKDGLLEHCMSPNYTPVLAIKKFDSCYGLVHNLRAINQIVQSRHPVVPNPLPSSARYHMIINGLVW
jgi:hypothetical protein